MKLTTFAKQFFLTLGLVGLALVFLGDFSFAQGLEVPDPIEGISSETDFRKLILQIVRFFLGFLGILAVVMLIYAGFLYVSSAGNEEKVNQAKKILLYAVIGIVVIGASFAIVTTLITGLSGAGGQT